MKCNESCNTFNFSREEVERLFSLNESVTEIHESKDLKTSEWSSFYQLAGINLWNQNQVLHWKQIIHDSITTVKLARNTCI
jgi:hypothetical protein